MATRNTRQEREDACLQSLRSSMTAQADVVPPRPPYHQENEDDLSEESDNDSNETFPDHSVPPHGMGPFENREEALKAVNTHALPYGYAMCNGRSALNGRKLYFRCDRWRDPKSYTAKGANRASSMGTGCTFSIHCVEVADKQFEIRHRPYNHTLKVNYNHHCGHGPTANPRNHKNHRTLSTTACTELARLVADNSDFQTIKKHCQHDNPHITDGDIQRHILTARDVVSEGKNHMHLLGNEMRANGWWNISQVHGNTTTACLFGHPEMLNVLRSYHRVLIMDCNFQPNKYGLFLFNIIGVEACGKSFMAGFCYMSGLSDKDFQWVLQTLRQLLLDSNIEAPNVFVTDKHLVSLNAIKSVFPAPQTHALICHWHAAKSIFSFCRPQIADEKEWEIFEGMIWGLIESPTVDDYTERLESFRDHFNTGHSRLVKYIETHTLIHAEQLVVAWVNEHMHFGVRPISREEGIHAAIKSFFPKKSMSLWQSWPTIKEAVDDQLSKLKLRHASGSTLRQDKFKPQLFSVIRATASFHALGLVQTQWLLFRKALEERKLAVAEVPLREFEDLELPTSCSFYYLDVMGLPCAHHMARMWNLQRSMAVPNPEIIILSDQVSPQWHLMNTTGEEGPSLTLGIETTKTKRVREKNTCKGCGVVGHRVNSKSCPNYAEYLERKLHEAVVID